MGKGGSADDCGHSIAAAAALTTAYFARYRADAQPAPLLTGADLMQLGVRPGPRMGRVLDAVREAQMMGDISDTAAALVFAQRLLTQNS